MAITLMLSVLATGCQLTYVLHVGTGHFRLLYGSIPVEKALKDDSLTPKQKEHLRLVAQVKEFGQRELGLKETQNYQTVYLKSRQSPIYVVSASPKDQLSRKTWWFPVVGEMPYLGFFDIKRAREEKEKLVNNGLDVTIGTADAYSTLGWFKDPLTLNLLEGSTVELVEIILHEMTHATLYVKAEGEFNEALAVMVGKVGTFQFLERTHGPSHPLSIEAQNAIEDERVFSAFLNSLLEKLERLYNSSLGFEKKLIERERIFARALEQFGNLKSSFRTRRFDGFGSVELNNAYLLSTALYHQHFHIFEALLKQKEYSIRETLLFFRDLAKRNANIMDWLRDWYGSEANRFELNSAGCRISNSQSDVCECEHLQAQGHGTFFQEPRNCLLPEAG
jgi:predicted aminopeptidase